MNLKEAVEFTQTVRETWQPGSKGYQTCMINIGHVMRILGEDFPMEDATSLTFHVLIRQLKEEGKSPATINRIQQGFSCVHNTLVRYGYLDKKIQRTTLREPSGRMEFYEEDEIQSMIDAADKLGYKYQIVKDTIRFAAQTGCRKGELLKLEWSDIDHHNKTIQFRDTKTHETRVLPLTNGLKELLDEVYSHRMSDQEVFPIDKDVLRRRFKDVQKEAGITGDKCFHTLRHSAATQLFARNVPLPVVKAILGHKNTNTTMRYAKATSQGMIDALDKLEL